MAQSVKLKRSSVVSNGNPKLPTAAQIEVGEIAINFAEGHETLSTKNSNNGIATFSSDAVLDKKYISSGSVVSAISAVTKTIEDNEYVIAQAFNDQDDRIEALEEAGFLTGYTETDPTVPAWAKASTKPTYTASEVGALSTATTYFDDVEYDSNTKRINFKKNNSVIDYVDATAFIKDGMVSSVTVSNGNLVISFNTEAGREDIELALTQIFNPNNYYDKTTADGKFLTGFTESDPTVPAWAKQSSKPSYTAAEVGALPDTTDIPTEAKIAASGFTKSANVRSDWYEMDSSANSYIVNSPVVSGAGPDSTVYGIRAAMIDGCDGVNYYFPEGDGLFFNGYTGGPLQHIIVTDKSLANAGPIGDNSRQWSASPNSYGLVKTGNFINNNGGVISVATGTNSSTVARGDHSHAGMLTGVTINGSAATVSNGNASFNIELGGGGSGSGLPTVSASDNGKILQVVDGQWTLVTPTVVYTGNGTPDNVLGNDGDIYLQTS